MEPLRGILVRLVALGGSDPQMIDDYSVLATGIIQAYSDVRSRRLSCRVRRAVPSGLSAPSSAPSTIGP